MVRSIFSVGLSLAIAMLPGLFAQERSDLVPAARFVTTAVEGHRRCLATECRFDKEGSAFILDVSSRRFRNV